MEFIGLISWTQPFVISTLAMAMGLLFCVIFGLIIGKVLYLMWVSPNVSYMKLKRNGFGGPSPSFPLGNIREMKRMNKIINKTTTHNHLGILSHNISHDIHSIVFPFFASWHKSHGKVFIYWLGTEPFLYIADAEFLKKMSGEVLAKSWGKPQVFKRDRNPMFGKGMISTEGDDWVRHRHVITPAFNPFNLKAMVSLMVESTRKMLDNWTSLMNNSVEKQSEIDIEREITEIAGEIIAKTSFGLNYQNGKLVFEKLRALQRTLFMNNRLVGVPLSNLLYLKKTIEARRLGKEIDQLFFSIINDRRKSINKENWSQNNDLLSLLLKASIEGDESGKSLTNRELVDECKTFFFGGHETTALAITWSMLLLAIYQDWQLQLREEIKQVIGDKEIDATLLNGLKKMGWVMNEALRLYPSAPNAQRQARQDIKVGDMIIPQGTNIWIDVVSMHHDSDLWGNDVNEFKPERFKDDKVSGGCKHKMGYLPFGFGGRMCVGRNLTFLEYKLVLTLILSSFSFTLSPTYSHSPSYLLSLRPTHGLPLLLLPL